MAHAQALVTGLLLAAIPAARDVYFEQTTITMRDGRAGGPGVVSRVWYAGKRMRMEAGSDPRSPALILRLDTGTAYRLDPAHMRAVAIDADRLRARTQMDLAMAGDLMGAEEGSARTRPLTAPKTIAGYSCQGYRITAGSTVLDVYVAQGIPVGIEAFADFLEWSGASQALAGILDEVRKLPGFPLETRSRIHVLGEVHETRSTVTKVQVGPHPASLFEPPPGYRVVAEEPPPEP